MSKRYLWDEKEQKLVEIGDDWRPTFRKECNSTEELVYGGMRATDGTPINTRAKHRKYMKEKNLTTVDDFVKTWPKELEKREAYRGKPGTTYPERKEIREAIERAWYRQMKS